MDSGPQYYSAGGMTNNESPTVLSSRFVQHGLSSQSQAYTMSDTGYPLDQFGMHTHTTLGQSSITIPEPPPYDEFTGYDWPVEDHTLFPTQPDDFSHPSLLDSDEARFIFNEFLENLQEDNGFIFNPSLPTNMPTFPHTSSDNNINDSFHPVIYPVNYNPLSNHSPDLLGRHQFSSSNSTSLSPRTSNITLSSSPKHISRELGQSSQLTSPISEEKDAAPSVPAKRKQDNDDERSRRRSSNPRLSPINTKLVMTRSHSSTSSPRPISPSMQLSNLSINSNSNHNFIDNENDNDDSPGNTPSSSNNGSPSPRTPNRELAKNEEEESTSLSNLADTESNENDNNTDDYAEIKSESKPTPQKSSRKPYKELLTEEEKRANHIASEQKRRNTIRAGFKELTDIIPTLKNVNNSKSTILFKAVDYIKYLERRNRNLKERAGLLEMRVEMEMRQGRRFHHNSGFGPAMGFGHQRVGPMSMGAAYGMNGMAIPIGPGHPPPQAHVMTPQQMQNIYFVSTGADSQSLATQQQIMSAGGVVNPTNNFRGGMQIPSQQQPQQTNNDNNSTNGLVPGMNIPAMANDDDQEMTNHNNNVDTGMVGVDHDGDSPMIVMNGNPSRVGVKCL